MNAILGINMAYHESAAALVVDGALVAACEEERFNRIKHGKPACVDTVDATPSASIETCLGMAAIDAANVDVVALSYSTALRAASFTIDPLSKPGDWGSEAGEARFRSGLAQSPAAIRDALGADFAGRIVEVPHHLAHAASAFYPSGFDEAAVLVVDGIAENATSAIFAGSAHGLRECETVQYPDSIGFLWEKLSQYSGFSEYDACKTMGLAAYGDPARFRDAMSALFTRYSDGVYHIDAEVARFRLDDFAPLENLFGPARYDGQDLCQHHYDVAAALQEATSEAMLILSRRAAQVAGSNRLCLAGGVALNCVCNAAINREGGFDDIYIPPAPHDAGTAVGAALQAWHARHGMPAQVTQSAFLGPSFGDEACDDAIDEQRLDPEDTDGMVEAVVDLLCEGKIVGWFQGQMEFGPRALGNRSLVADPRRADMRDIINRKVKHREDFRPFAPSVLKEEAAKWFDIGPMTVSHGYMLYTVPVRPEFAALIPAVLHVDGTARVQIVDRQDNPVYHRLISAFAERTGVPMLLNTSFNDSEPIVCSPRDALATFTKTSIDAVVLRDRLVLRESLAVAG